MESGAPVPLKDGGFQQGPQGESLLSKLPVDQFKLIAAAGGGGDMCPRASRAENLIDELKEESSDQACEEKSYESTAQYVQSWCNGWHLAEP